MKKTIRQRGMAIIAAIFILVVLAGLGAVALTFSTSQHVSSGQDLLGTRALYAARSGLEWGAYQMTITPGTYPTPAAACFANQNVAMPAQTLSMFTVTVTCDRNPDGAGRLTPVFLITSTACNEPSGGVCPNTTNPSSMYIERQVEMLF